MSQLTVQEINGAIISGGLTNEELNQITDAVRYARARLVRVNKPVSCWATPCGSTASNVVSQCKVL